MREGDSCWSCASISPLRLPFLLNNIAVEGRDREESNWAINGRSPCRSVASIESASVGNAQREKQRFHAIRKPRVTRRGCNRDSNALPQRKFAQPLLISYPSQLQMQNIFLSGLPVTMMQYNNIPAVFP